MITILCPITSRNCGPDVSTQPLVRAILPSMTALAMWGDFRLVLGYDDDDPLWRDEAARAEIRWPVEWVQLRGMRGNLTAIWNELERRARPWEYLIPGNDDLAFETSPLDAVTMLHERNDFGTVAFNDHAFPGLPTFYVVHKLHVEIFRSLYPLPWTGAHQDTWIADVYRPWRASEIDERFAVHNRIGGVSSSRFDYGGAPDYRGQVMSGRRLVNRWLMRHPGIAATLSGDQLEAAPMLISEDA